MEKYSALNYVKIDVANQYGHDTWQFEKRIAWFDRMKNLNKMIPKAEKPYQFAAALHAYNDALTGTPSGHLVGLDACASGISLMGVMIGCHTTCSNTGVIGDKRMDMYRECTRAMKQIFDGILEHQRGDVKHAQMTHFYGSELTPKSIFGDHTEELDSFYLAQDHVAPGAVVVMQEFLNSWQAGALEHTCVMPDGFNMIVPVLCKMESKIEIDELDHAAIKYTYEDNIGLDEGLSIAANMTHAGDGFVVREVIRRCNYDPEQLTSIATMLNNSINNHNSISTREHSIEKRAVNYQFVSLSAIDYINQNNVDQFTDAYKMDLVQLIDETLCYTEFEVLTIHDEFKCLPNHMNDLRSVYNSVLAEIADSQMLEFMIQQVRNDYGYKIDKFSTNLGDAIYAGNYSLS